jgi:hypothetical protein
LNHEANEEKCYIFIYLYTQVIQFVLVKLLLIFVFLNRRVLKDNGGRRGCDRMVVELQLSVQSMPITTNVVSSNPVHGEVYSVQHHVIKFVIDLRQVGGFLWVPRFPPLIKLIGTI